MLLTGHFRHGGAWDAVAFDGQAAHATMCREFADVVREHPDELRTTTLQFAGAAVRLQVAGRELHDHLVRPFAHLRRSPDGAAPALRIDAWDTRLSARHGAATPPEETWHELTLHSRENRFLAQRLPHTHSCLDRHEGHLCAAIDWHNRIFIYERAKPFARPLLTWHNDRGVQVIHTALVSRHGRGVLFAGRSGSGKSTASLACVMAGFDYLAEDYVALERRADGSFRGHSLYASVFLYTAHLRRFDTLAVHAVHGRPPQEEKSVVILSDIWPHRLAASAPISAIVFPQVGTGSAELVPMSKSAALLALAPSSLLQIPNRKLGAAGFARLADLVERVPCFTLRTGTEPGDIAPAVASLTDGHRAP